MYGNSCPTFKHSKVPYQIGRSYPGAGEFLPSGNKFKVLDEGDFEKIENDDVINIENDVNLVVKFTPGHADDHICLLLETPKLSALFSGDNILGGTTAVFDRGLYLVKFCSFYIAHTLKKIQNTVFELFANSAKLSLIFILESMERILLKLKFLSRKFKR